MCIRIAVLVSVALSAASAAAETAAVQMDLQEDQEGPPADPVSALVLDREGCLHRTFEDVHSCCFNNLNKCICIVFLTLENS